MSSPKFWISASQKPFVSFWIPQSMWIVSSCHVFSSHCAEWHDSVSFRSNRYQVQRLYPCAGYWQRTGDCFYVCCGNFLISESYKLILFFIIVIAILAFIGFFSKKANRILRTENQKIFRRLIKYIKKTELKKSVPFLM